MGWGDEILAAGQAQKHFDRTGEPVAILDLHRRPRWHPIWEGNPAILAPARLATNGPHYPTIVSAQNARPYIVYPFTAEGGWTFNRDFHARDHIARIYLTEEEQALGVNLLHRLGPYVLVEPWSKHPNLRWPRAHWQALVDSRPDLTFVQHTHAGSDYWLEGVHHISTQSFRAACGVLDSASVYVRGESGMLHAAAALRIPAVAIWGGCMDWEVLGNYPTHVGVGISTPPCGSYLPCEHCRQQMERISPSAVSHAIDRALLIRAPRPEI